MRSTDGRIVLASGRHACVTKVLRVLFLLSKRQPPSSRLRMTACFDDFRARGIEPTGLPIPSGPVGRLRMIAAARTHDAVVLQKKTSLHTWELKLLRRANPRLVFDMDDAVMFHELEHHQPLTGKNFVKFVRTVDHCAAVVAGNHFLAELAQRNCGLVRVLPTPIDLARYRLKDYGSTHGDVVIGWLGTGGGLYHLRRLEPVLRSLGREFPNLRLKIVSNAFIDMEGVRVEKQRWSEAGEIDALRSFDVGIMPLEDNLWTQGKCGYKILQYFGAGVCAVASPVGINREFVLHGQNGFLADTAQEWENALRALLADAALRRNLGRCGRQTVERRYARAIYADAYAALLRDVANKPA